MGFIEAVKYVYKRALQVEDRAYIDLELYEAEGNEVGKVKAGLRISTVV